MSRDVESLRIVTNWLGSLADLTRHQADARPSKTALAAYAALLGADFPSGAFTTVSLGAVVVGLEWWPAYDVIRQRVAEWWRDHKPRSAMALAGPPDMPPAPELAGMDLEWFRYFFKRQGEGFGPIREGERPSSRAVVLSLVHQHSAAAYARIGGESVGA